MKKVFLFTLFFMFLIPISSLAATQDVISNQALTPYQKITDNDDNSYYEGTSKEIIINFTEPVSRNSIVNLEMKFQYMVSRNIVFVDDKGNDLPVISLSNTSPVSIDIPSQDQTIVTSVKIQPSSGQSYRISYLKINFDPSLNTFIAPVSVPVVNLKEVHSHNSATLSWSNPQDVDFDGVLILQNGVQIADLGKNLSAYSITNLTASNAYSFDVVSKYKNSRPNSTPSTITVMTDVAPIDTTPPSEVSSMMVTKTSDIVDLLYSLPIDSDFSHLEIYRDNVLLESNYKSNTYQNFNLVPNTMYVYKIVSVDLIGNKSSGYIQTVTTAPTVNLSPPTAPTGLNITVGNASGRINWKPNPERDVTGYNIYVDGVKNNSSLVLATNFILTGLNNGQSYNISVTAVNTSGIESMQSALSVLVPSQSAMPVFKSNYNLKDVADGTNSWFATMWPLLAFSVGITLAFVVARRVKLLFFA